MNAARARRLLLAAIAISLLIHLILAAYLRWGFRPNAPNEVVRVRTMTIARRPVPTPPPTPVPTVHPSSAPTTAPSARVVPPSLKTHGSNGPPHVRAPGKTVAAPTP